MQFAIELCTWLVPPKYGGARDRSAQNMVVQGTGRFSGTKIWWCRGQITAEIWWCRGQITAEIWWCRGQVQIARSIIPTVYSIFCGLVFSLLIIRLNLKRHVVSTVPC